MAFAIMIEWPGMTQEKYDQILEKVNLVGGKLPPRGIFHISGPLPDGGLRIVDVWEEQEAFERFAEERFLPAARELGYDPDPAIRSRWEVVHVITGEDV